MEFLFDDGTGGLDDLVDAAISLQLREAEEEDDFDDWWPGMD